MDLVIGFVEASLQLVFLKHELLEALDRVGYVIEDVHIQVEVILAPLVLCLPGCFSQSIVDSIQTFTVRLLASLGIQTLLFEPVQFRLQCSIELLCLRLS